MKNFSTFSIGYVLAGMHFWFGVGIFYYLERGLSVEQAMLLVAFYSAGAVLFEYPTGVLADFYGHKKSLVAGLLVLGVSFFVSSFPLPFWGYVLNIVIGSFGGALASGSNVALLHGIVSDFRESYARVQSTKLLLSALSIFIGGLLYKLHIALPFVLTSLATFGACVFYARVQVVENSVESDHFFALMKKSIVFVVRHRVLQIVLLFGSVFFLVQLSMKWVAPTIFSLQGADPALFATVLSIGTLLMAFCTRIAGSRYVPPLGAVIFCVCFGIAALAFGNAIWALAVGVLLAHAFQGMINVSVKHAINAYAVDSLRASINSLEHFIARILVVGYLPLMGFFLGVESLFYLYGVFTLALMVGVSVLALIFVPDFKYQPKQKR